MSQGDEPRDTEPGRPMADVAPLRRIDLPCPVGLAQSALLHLPRVNFQIPGIVVHFPTSPRNGRRPWGQRTVWHSSSSGEKEHPFSL